MVGLAAEFLSVHKDMMDKIGEFIGIGIGVEDFSLGEEDRHGFIGNGKKEAMKALNFMVMFSVDHCQTDAGEVQPYSLVHVFQRLLGHELGLGIVAQLGRNGEVVFLAEIFTVWQGGGRADVDVGDFEGSCGSSKIQGPEIVDFQGQMGVGADIGNGRVDDKIGLRSFEVVPDISRIPDGKLFAAWRAQFYSIRGLGLEIMGQCTANEAGSSDENAQKFC